MAHAGSVNTQGAKAGTVRVEGQPELQSKARPEILPWEHHKETAKMEGESEGWRV